MTSGLQPHDRPGAPNYMSLILGLPLQHAPGSRWAYASAPVDLLSLVASAVAGGTLRDFFNRHIAAPLGIPAVAWGNIAGQSATGASSKASMRSRDLARIGYLLMQRGHWAADGTARRVLSPARVEAMVSGLGLAGSLHLPTAGSSFPVASDSPRFYGQLWWSNRTASALGAKVPRDAFYAHGLLEKLLVVVPSLDLLVVRYGSGPRAQIGFKRELMSRIIDALL